MSSAILQAGVRLYREAVDRGDLVGAVLLVARDGKVVLQEPVGVAEQGEGAAHGAQHDVPHGLEHQADHRDVRSRILVEEGKLSWEDPVRKYIPSFDNYRPGSSRSSTS